MAMGVGRGKCDWQHSTANQSQRKLYTHSPI